MKLSMIFCRYIHFGISKNNSIPWKSKLDQTYFLDVTRRKLSKQSKNACIMGKTTFLDLKTPLSDRINIVVSKTLFNQNNLNNQNNQNDIIYVNTIKESIEYCKNNKINNVFIVGGKQIYEDFANKYSIDEVYENIIMADYECDNILNLKTNFENLNNKQDTFEMDFYAKFNLDMIYEKTTKILYDYDCKQNIKIIKYKPRTYPNKLYKKNIKITEIDSLPIQTISYTKIDNSHSNNHYAYQDCYGEQGYLNLLHKVLDTGYEKQTRNSLVKSLDGEILKFNLEEGFPLLTTKKTNFEWIFHELMMFIKGITDTNYLKEKGINIWDGNTNKEFLLKQDLDYEEGEMGPMYGYQWRTFNGQVCDQLEYVLDELKTNPSSRRILMTTYNPLQKDDGVLFPCHGISIIFTVNDNKLNCNMTQRSADLFLGLPFNIASYALLMHLICDNLNNTLIPGILTINIADAHIYNDHIFQCQRQILRDPFSFPKLSIKNHHSNIEDYEYPDLELIDYESYPGIKATMIA